MSQHLGIKVTASKKATLRTCMKLVCNELAALPSVRALGPHPSWGSISSYAIKIGHSLQESVIFGKTVKGGNFPDRTPNQSVYLQQGEKWRTNSYFQQPMFTHNNVDFWSAIPKKKGTNAASLLPEIVDDLKMLENSVVMFSAEDNVYVLVVSALLWIEADTPCHLELCCLGVSNSTYPCRKCYIKLQSQIPKLNEVEYYTNRHPTRTKNHYIQAASTPDRDTVIPDIPYFDDKNTAEELSFKNKSIDKLLKLKAYDQSKDTPAEILHYILLGIPKYLITSLVKVVLNKNKKELEELFDYVKDYKNSRGISRAFTRSLTHAGSFLGRVFKVLIQILLVILAIKFADTEVLQEITPLFVRLDCLCSLVFVRSIDNQYETYISEVDSAIRSLIEALHKYDTNCKPKKHAFYMSKPKVHLLTHLPEDLRRFRPALNYKTEKGEQFNKHICEHLFHTNRMNTLKDICLKFGKQYMTRHIIDGGSWIGKNGLRETCGKAIAEYMQQNSDRKFHETLLGGSREFADNNSTGIVNCSQQRTPIPDKNGGKTQWDRRQKNQWLAETGRTVGRRLHSGISAYDATP
ncbi:hypothetical protein J3Q64DRAFT_1850057 [Phycomyces blakesleeanus]|uniref:Uncharacterized protein n=1 Tax=Phycomyces blakesleeanus TaxID=4837 RepID=A0ABR3AUM2_PHYBL